MACVTQRTSRIVYVLFHLIGSLVICANADVITNCSNAATCIRTYADIYNSLASDENSFNISSALYPANEPSSVLVFVNISVQIGPDKTGDNGVREYTWSLRSLYAAFPAVFLEISSLSSILVTARTRNLTITIPYFCCNVSEEDRNKRIKDVLAAVSILAISSYFISAHSRIQDVSTMHNKFAQKFRKVSDESFSQDEMQRITSHEVFFHKHFAIFYGRNEMSVILKAIIQLN